jgi:acetyl esterase/lipase
MQLPRPEVKVAAVEDRRIPGPAGEIPVRIYRPEGKAPFPVLVYFHGGGWVEGSKDDQVFNWMPYATRGFTVVNVGYRLGRVALAPAAVEDARCALRWIVRNAAEHKFDLDRIVTTGHSAGGHLALTTGMLIPADGFDATCPTDADTRWSSGAEPRMRVAAVVNWFGITDVADLLAGPNAKHYAIEWLGALPNRAALAEAVSPLRLVRPSAPPVLSVHGDADPLVPYSHAVRLHAALEKAGVQNRLHTIVKGDHGGFSVAEQRAAFDAIFAFLGERGLLPAAQ